LVTLFFSLKEGLRFPVISARLILNKEQSDSLLLQSHIEVRLILGVLRFSSAIIHGIPLNLLSLGLTESLVSSESGLQDLDTVKWGNTINTIPEILCEVLHFYVNSLVFLIEFVSDILKTSQDLVLSQGEQEQLNWY